MLIQRINEANSLVEVIDLNDLPEDDAQHILDMWDNDQPAWIGECEYRPFADEGELT